MIIRDYKEVDGIYIFDGDIKEEHQDYDSTGLDIIFQHEEKHFWFITRKEFILKNLRKFISKDDRILDAGGGTGDIAKYLIDNGYTNVAVGDMHINGLRYAKSKGIKNCYRFNLFEPPFKDEFDVVCIFDVLEHIKEDLLILENINKMLKQNGKIVITVPAHQCLWSNFDVLSGHKRRYTKKEMERLLNNTGFQILYARYFFISIVPLIFLRKLILSKSLGLKNTDLSINPFINRSLLLISRIENSLNHSLPNIMGSSLLVIGEKI